MTAITDWTDEFAGVVGRIGARFARAAYRIELVPSDRLDDVGFRCARVQMR